MIPTLMSNFTVYLISFSEIRAEGAEIQGPKIGFCAPNVTLSRTTVDAIGRGCPSDSGLGAGDHYIGCSSGGASHGGVGGYGGLPIGSTAIITTCTQNTVKPYYFGEEARYEGSGGASGLKDGKLGGAGGGIIWFSTTNTISLDSSLVLAEGGHG